MRRCGAADPPFRVADPIAPSIPMSVAGPLAPDKLPQLRGVTAR
jgi:hypothetical protein